MPTAAVAIADMTLMFKTAWDADPATTGLAVLYDNVPGEAPTGFDANGNPLGYARFMIRHATGSCISLADANGIHRYEHMGVLIVQTYTFTGSGITTPILVAEVVKNAFEGKSSPNNVRFRNARYNQIGTDGNHFEVDVLVDFEYDEIR